ncbi:HNH endonuclease [Francisella philomiragia]|uniref:HNH endonuclease n=1 Tax=Francisella philomiragia TaxID=28110 RepID=UPI001905A7D9|nr:HNH endonuclease signature motif containing protein [Francisella philomiragia]MBK2267112.1 HNH endonuclease [Francisella philomiragia]MBK2278388.1 HNH endonuclease [Francisella philomiragia]MBK2286422.1 HNH endonuclease [Francisella philomiragia]MBK2288219.1 HNH endonuclease [Francisella philomiragia]MBK2291546.1 HNH endonuclease [Francisella philomiragia]
MKSEQRAYFVWDELVKVAKAHTIITYSDLANRINCHHRALYYPLGYIQDYCLDERLPPLTMLVVNKATRLPGNGFIATDRKLFDKTLDDIYEYNWDKLDKPFSVFKDGNSIDKFVKQILASDSVGEIYTKVKSRGIAQSLFRRALLDAYNNKCAISGITIKECLEAAHIIPWTHADDNQKLDVRNGILLSATLHRLFDAGIIEINEDYTVVVNGIDESNADILKYHGQKVRLPNKVHHRPSADYLNNRNT